MVMFISLSNFLNARLTFHLNLDNMIFYRMGRMTWQLCPPNQRGQWGEYCFLCGSCQRPFSLVSIHALSSEPVNGI